MDNLSKVLLDSLGGRVDTGATPNWATQEHELLLLILRAAEKGALKIVGPLETEC
jgi:hypothetical protein